MSDLSVLKNERERLMTKYESNTYMLELYIELVKEYHGICLEIDQSIVEIDQAIHTINNIKSL